jgi:hypothetical protein
MQEKYRWAEDFLSLGARNADAARVAENPRRDIDVVSLNRSMISPSRSPSRPEDVTKTAALGSKRYA